MQSCKEHYLFGVGDYGNDGTNGYINGIDNDISAEWVSDGRLSHV